MGIRLFSGRAVPRWVILLTDLTLSASSFTFSYFVVKHFEFAEILRGHFFWYTGLFSVISLIVFYTMRIHTGLIRYSNVHDMFRIFAAVFITSIIYPVIVSLVSRRSQSSCDQLFYGVEPPHYVAYGHKRDLLYRCPE